MLTIRTCKVFSHALGEYLQQAEYYSQGMRVNGECFGRLCKRVGLTESGRIALEAELFGLAADGDEAGGLGEDGTTPTGLPRSSGRSCCSTDAENESKSMARLRSGIRQRLDGRARRQMHGHKRRRQRPFLCHPAGWEGKHYHRRQVFLTAGESRRRGGACDGTTSAA